MSHYNRSPAKCLIHPHQSRIGPIAEFKLGVGIQSGSGGFIDLEGRGGSVGFFGVDGKGGAICGTEGEAPMVMGAAAWVEDRGGGGV
jgi:hypothetical protein